ncbi:hypothetical protein JCGZ_19395 [Jatropha curcas]|uniref:Uncharacterized protein n=1 Tax=Jatropha curcas TaxID=180498 RepID=A0A067JZK0_JATCU|nr:hypothetical protein JCGZ_19395 [Jatropha curcas]
MPIKNQISESGSVRKSQCFCLSGFAGNSPVSSRTAAGAAVHCGWKVMDAENRALSHHLAQISRRSPFFMLVGEIGPLIGQNRLNRSIEPPLASQLIQEKGTAARPCYSARRSCERGEDGTSSGDRRRIDTKQ